MTITVEQVRELRERTGAGVMDAKRALESTAGDMEAAMQVLQAQGAAAAAKKGDRPANQGVIVSYLHGSPARLGALVELNCETDFVARTPQFQQLAQNLAMQVAAVGPDYVRVEDIPAEALEAERSQAAASAGAGKPAEIVAKIVSGKVDKWLDEVVLLRQRYIRDEEQRVGDLITNAVAELGENIVVRRMARFELGEEA
jgi:elongation factor Ts